MPAELEIWRQIWNVDYHQVVEVGPDPDGFGCVEIRLKDSDDKHGEVLARITLPTDSARLLAQAINQCAYELEQKENKKR